MANHALYIGGPPTRNYSRAMFPAPTFNIVDPEFGKTKVSAHKNPAQFDINRTLDFKNEYALAEYVRNTTFAQGDTLDVILVPKRVLAVGLLYSVETAGPAGLSITPSLVTDPAPIPLPVIDAAVADDGVSAGWGYAAVGDAAWQVASAELANLPFFVARPSVIRLTLTAFDPADGFGNLKLHLCPVVTKFEGGAW